MITTETTLELELLNNLTARFHFGRDMAMRVMACGLLMASKTAEKGHGDMAGGIRIAIGALKRIRRANGYKLLPWRVAIEQLEAEQDEGRHYSMTLPSPTHIEAARVGAVNNPHYTNPLIKARAKSKATVKAACMQAIHARVSAEQDVYDQHIDEQCQVREFVEEYWQTISNVKRAYLHSALCSYRAQETIGEDVRKNISKRYAPKGVKPMEFLELLARYIA
jgi:hypothetical protein